MTEVMMAGIMRRTAVMATLLFAGCAVSVRSGGRDASSGPAPALAADQAHAAAQALLDHGAAAWNAGDLDGFVSDYAADATFVTSRSLVRGREAIRALYAPRFRPGAVRDLLRFEDLAADALAPDLVHLVARYVLTRGDSVTSRGPTSLILRRVGGRWLIVHDHSS